MTDAVVAAECGSCKAPILWLHHTVTGRNAPIDRDPSPEGNIVIDLDEGTYRVLDRLALADARATYTPVYTLHFVTCPDAEKHRGRRV